MPNLKDLKNRIAVGQIDPQDHQGHADGGRGEAAPGAGRREAARPYAERHGA